ncbi:hypothetical protein HK101_010158 [Irineochytrium annulatum]|nr:hypothetical protein HK101_010158 [Irineochytrium annulatum]
MNSMLAPILDVISAATEMEFELPGAILVMGQRNAGSGDLSLITESRPLSSDIAERPRWATSHDQNGDAGASLQTNEPPSNYLESPKKRRRTQGTPDIQKLDSRPRRSTAPVEYFRDDIGSPEHNENRRPRRSAPLEYQNDIGTQHNNEHPPLRPAKPPKNLEPMLAALLDVITAQKQRDFTLPDALLPGRARAKRLRSRDQNADEPSSKRRKMYEAPPVVAVEVNYGRYKLEEEKPVLLTCDVCNGALSTGDIVKCDFCTAFYHVGCVRHFPKEAIEAGSDALAKLYRALFKRSAKAWEEMNGIDKGKSEEGETERCDGKCGAKGPVIKWACARHRGFSFNGTPVCIGSSTGVVHISRRAGLRADEVEDGRWRFLRMTEIGESKASSKSKASARTGGNPRTGEADLASNPTVVKAGRSTSSGSLSERPPLSVTSRIVPGPTYMKQRNGVIVEIPWTKEFAVGVRVQAPAKKIGEDVMKRRGEEGGVDCRGTDNYGSAILLMASELLASVP